MRAENLVGALEFRHCMEIANVSAKLVFDGSFKDPNVTCITYHGDYIALTNRTVPLQVASLMRDSNGRFYRRRSGVSQNE